MSYIWSMEEIAAVWRMLLLLISFSCSLTVESFSYRRNNYVSRKLKASTPTKKKSRKSFPNALSNLDHPPTFEPLKTPYCPRKQEFFCASISPHTVTPLTLFTPPSHPSFPFSSKSAPKEKFLWMVCRLPSTLEELRRPSLCPQVTSCMHPLAQFPPMLTLSTWISLKLDWS